MTEEDGARAGRSPTSRALEVAFTVLGRDRAAGPSAICFPLSSFLWCGEDPEHHGKPAASEAACSSVSLATSEAALTRRGSFISHKPGSDMFKQQ